MKLAKILIFIILVIITYYSLRLPSDESLPTNDKVGHFLAYASLSYSIQLICFQTRQKWIGVIFSFCYGLTMEIGQGFVPGRDPSFMDMLANSCGVLIGFVLPFRTKVMQVLEKLESNIF